MKVPRRIVKMSRRGFTLPRCIVTQPRRIVRVRRVIVEIAGEKRQARGRPGTVRSEIVTLPRHPRTLPKPIFTIPRTVVTLPKPIFTIPRTVVTFQHHRKTTREVTLARRDGARVVRSGVSPMRGDAANAQGRFYGFRGIE
jgi:hypothetical protein